MPFYLRLSRVVLLAAVVIGVSGNCVRGQDPFSAPAEGRGYLEGRTRTTALDEIIARHDLDNPNKHEAARQTALVLEETAKRLEKLGRDQTRARDFVSPLDGKFTSYQSVRNEGALNIDRASENKAEAAAIREAIRHVLDRFEEKARTPSGSKMYALSGANGGSIKAQLIEERGGRIVVRRADGAYFQMEMHQLADSSKEEVRTAFYDRRLQEVGREMPSELDIHLESEGKRVSVLWELPADGKIGVRDSGGAVWVSGYSFPSGTFTAQAEEKLRIALQEIERLRGMVAKESAALHDELSKALRKAGGPERFVVERVLSFSKFPLREHGNYIYQVSISGNPTILVTRDTQYITAGVGELLLKPIGNYDVVMESGETRTVPALVEVDQAIIDHVLRLRTAIAMIEDRHRDALQAAEREKRRQEDVIGNLKKNLEAFHKKVVQSAVM